MHNCSEEKKEVEEVFGFALGGGDAAANARFFDRMQMRERLDRYVLVLAAKKNFSVEIGDDRDGMVSLQARLLVKKACNLLAIVDEYIDEKIPEMPEATGPVPPKAG